LNFKLPNLSKFAKFAVSIEALVIREIKLADANFFMGLLYTYIKTFFFILSITLFFYYGLRGSLGGDLSDIIKSISIPFIFFFFFMDIANKSSKMMLVYKNLFNLPNVNPFNACLAIFLSNLVIYFFIAASAVVLLNFFGINIPIFKLMSAATLIVIFNFSYSFFISFFLFENTIFEKIHDLLLRVAMFISSVLIPVEVFPLEIQKILYWNPLVHIMDYSRYSMGLGPYELASPLYVFAISAFMFLTSFVIYRLRINI